MSNPLYQQMQGQQNGQTQMQNEIASIKSVHT